MISKSFELMNKLEDEEERIFEEYQYKLKKAEYERLVEEGVIEAEMQIFQKEHKGNIIF